MKKFEHTRVSGFSGNEIFCLNKLNFDAGQLCLGNNVIALGALRGIGAGLSTLAGGEVEEVTNLVHEGRKHAFDKMMQEAKSYGGIGIAGVSFDIVNHIGNLEFIAIGSTIHSENKDQMLFSTSANAQELYCQLDAGFQPISFVFSNIAYSIGVGGSIFGAIRGLARGEVPQYTKIFEKTRNLALKRIKNEAKKVGANAIIGIQTSIMPLLGTQEMMMLGTASNHAILENFANDPVTSDMTNEEMWNLVNIGYMPIELVMGVSVYSLGFTAGITSTIKSFIGGKVESLTEVLYEAREKAFNRLEEAAEKCGADRVVGVKTHIYDLGSGLVEFMVIGTAVKKVSDLTTLSETLPPQAIIQDRETFVDTSQGDKLSARGEVESASITQKGPLSIITIIILAIFYLVSVILGK
ncbi:MAG: heavy metal-binding domain-containing protein [Rickettsiales bacterium]|nr:heavy metal-binding domain-containing protein [Rickettsiales bacterium]